MSSQKRQANKNLVTKDSKVNQSSTSFGSGNLETDYKTGTGAKSTSFAIVLSSSEKSNCEKGKAFMLAASLRVCDTRVVYGLQGHYPFELHAFAGKDRKLLAVYTVRLLEQYMPSDVMNLVFGYLSGNSHYDLDYSVGKSVNSDSVAEYMSKFTKNPALVACSVKGCFTSHRMNGNTCSFHSSGKKDDTHVLVKRNGKYCYM